MGWALKLIEYEHEIAKMVEALKFYADRENMDEDGRYGHQVGHVSGQDVWELDGGRVAQQALITKK